MRSYLFCIASDNSRGAKGNNKASKDLSVGKTKKEENAVDAAVQTAEADISAPCEDAIHALSTKPPKKKWMQQPYMVIYCRNSRTMRAASHPHPCHGRLLVHYSGVLLTVIL